MEDKTGKSRGVGKVLIFYPDLIYGTSFGKTGRNTAFSHTR
jgi:hypothetical protein